MKKTILSLALMLVLMSGLVAPVAVAEWVWETLPDGSSVSWETLPNGTRNQRIRNPDGTGGLRLSIIPRTDGSSFVNRWLQEGETLNMKEEYPFSDVGVESLYSLQITVLGNNVTIVGEPDVVYENMIIQYRIDSGNISISLHNLNYTGTANEFAFGSVRSPGADINVTLVGNSSIRGRIMEPGTFLSSLTFSGSGTLTTDTFIYRDGVMTPIENGTDPTPAPTPLDGADGWAVPVLEKALEAGLLIDAMQGNWTQPTSRLLAAEAMARVIEVSTGKTIDQIAAEKGFNMNNHFSDTNSKYVTFLREAGVTTGAGGGRYDPNGTFNRAQIVTMLWRTATNVLDMDLSGYPLGTDVFTDNIPNWAGTNEAIGWAAELGITTGISATRFDAFGTLTNQQTGVFSFRAFDKAFSADD